MKTLVIYVTHVINENVKYFLGNGGIIEDKNINYLIVLNGPDLKIDNKWENVRVINRKNVGHDFGGWSHGLFKCGEDIWKYERYIFINSTTTARK